MSNPQISVVELFAGVGGFRLGLEKSRGSYLVVWSNQWEPSTKRQHASEVYKARFGSDGHTNEDIATIATNLIPDHELLVGGFPCQDYSIASSLVNSKGLLGKKGVLWWTIYRILNEKTIKPKYLLLENVDRLLKSPSTQRGRDFAVMLRSLSHQGYAVEWRVINAADYGLPQRRRRIFFLGYHRSTKLYDQLKNHQENWLTETGIIAEAYSNNPVTKLDWFDLDDDLVEISQQFNIDGASSPFENTGLMIDGKVYTQKTMANYDSVRTVLGDILFSGEIPDEFYINQDDMEKWTYLKGAKKESRTTKQGFAYKYNEGNMIFPDPLDTPSRTIITGEGGRSASRFKHVVRTKKGLRRLLPIELERLNMFPDNHTKLQGISDGKRAFFMGNALVVGIVTQLANVLYERISHDTSPSLDV